MTKTTRRLRGEPLPPARTGDGNRASYATDRACFHLPGGLGPRNLSGPVPPPGYVTRALSGDTCTYLARRYVTFRELKFCFFDSWEAAFRSIAQHCLEDREGQIHLRTGAGSPLCGTKKSRRSVLILFLSHSPPQTGRAQAPFTLWRDV